MQPIAHALVVLGLAALLLPCLALAEGPSMQGGGTDQQDRRVDLSALSQELLVVDFAASWCEPCYEALPRLQALAKLFPDIHFVVVSVDDTVGGRDRLVNDLQLDLPVIWDQDHRIVEDFGPKGFPATYVVAAGEVIHQHVGTSAKAWHSLLGVLKSLPTPTGSDTVKP